MSSEVVNGLFALGGAVLGAVVTGVISWLQAKKTAKHKELTVFTSRPISLVEVDSMISEVIKITIGGTPVSTVYTLDVTLLNTGTETLHDVSVETLVAGHVLTCDIVSANFDPPLDEAPGTIKKNGNDLLAGR